MVWATNVVTSTVQLIPGEKKNQEHFLFEIFPSQHGLYHLQVTYTTLKSTMNCFTEVVQQNTSLLEYERRSSMKIQNYWFHDDECNAISDFEFLAVRHLWESISMNFTLFGRQSNSLWPTAVGLKPASIHMRVACFTTVLQSPTVWHN